MNNNQNNLVNNITNIEVYNKQNPLKGVLGNVESDILHVYILCSFKLISPSSLNVITFLSRGIFTLKNLDKSDFVIVISIN